MEKVEGGCQCGALRFVVFGHSDRVGIYHCLDCRKHHGAVFHASAVYPRDSVQIKGQPREYKGRYFCPACGSSVFSTSGNELEVHLGALDEPNQMSPIYELWTIRRESWLPQFPSLKRFDRNRPEEK